MQVLSCVFTDFETRDRGRLHRLAGQGRIWPPTVTWSHGGHVGFFSEMPLFAAFRAEREADARGFNERRIVGILGGVTCTGLQYACAGRLIITSSKDREILSIDGTLGCVLVVSSDDLSILHRLSSSSEWTVKLDTDILYSAESRWLALVYNRSTSRTYDKQIDRSDHTVAVAVYNIAGYDVRPLTHMCLETIFNSARCAPYHVTIDSLPVSNYVKQMCKSIVESSQK